MGKTDKKTEPKMPMKLRVIKVLVKAIDGSTYLPHNVDWGAMVITKKYRAYLIKHRAYLRLREIETKNPKDITSKDRIEFPRLHKIVFGFGEGLSC